MHWHSTGVINIMRNNRILTENPHWGECAEVQPHPSCLFSGTGAVSSSSPAPWHPPLVSGSCWCPPALCVPAVRCVCPETVPQDITSPQCYPCGWWCSSHLPLSTPAPRVPGLRETLCYTLHFSSPPSLSLLLPLFCWGRGWDSMSHTAILGNTPKGPAGSLNSTGPPGSLFPQDAAFLPLAHCPESSGQLLLLRWFQNLIPGRSGLVVPTSPWWAPRRDLLLGHSWDHIFPLP